MQVRKWFAGFHVLSSPAKSEQNDLTPFLNRSMASERISVLAITASSQHRCMLHAISINQGWDFVTAGTWAAALPVIERHRTGVVLLDGGLLGTDWRDALAMLLDAAHRCCVILMTSTTTDRVCNEFIQEGGYKILKTPLEQSEVVKAVSLAWGFWKTCIVRAYRY